MSRDVFVALAGTAALTLVALAAVGCGGGDGGGLPPARGSLSGTVVDRDTQLPLANADVSTTGDDDITDGQGEFELTGLSTGAHTVTISLAGYFTANLQVDVQGATALPTPVQLVPTQAPGPPTTISGTVSLSGASAQITVTAVDQSDPTNTDTEILPGPGGYGLRVPGAAVYDVTATAPGYDPQTQVVALPNLGDTVTDVDFTLTTP